MQRANEYINRQLSSQYTQREQTALMRRMLEHLAGWTHSQIYVDKDTKLDDATWHLLKTAIDRLKSGEPIQYILGFAPFYGLSFRVDRRVLIPRPETEELVDDAIRLMQSAKGNDLRCLDLCTGSGCIAISLAKHLPAKIDAWDISTDALDVAATNATLLNTRVQFSKQDVLIPFERTEGQPIYDLMISNPPYVLNQEKMDMSKGVYDFEPNMALFVPDSDPILFYRALGKWAESWLRPGGWLLMEINPLKHEALMQHFNDGRFSGTWSKKDLYGKNRFIHVQK
ncbi:MAG: peptide chain release factor N(5)-glutamine methyltransferase [Bacteroidales bacterium]|nr:peptide chain release factor N(5)-glutamine methyltransferase [Bacteroidales bacterium]MDD4770560.1 peptide chain release factor N(5)-glutamine methyltransferase [Bacteroidales bacterium]